MLAATNLKRTPSIVSPQLFNFADHFDFEVLIGQSPSSEVRPLRKALTAAAALLFTSASPDSGPASVARLPWQAPNKVVPCRCTECGTSRPASCSLSSACCASSAARRTVSGACLCGDLPVLCYVSGLPLRATCQTLLQSKHGLTSYG